MEDLESMRSNNLVMSMLLGAGLTLSLQASLTPIGFGIHNTDGVGGGSGTLLTPGLTDPDDTIVSGPLGPTANTNDGELSLSTFNSFSLTSGFVTGRSSLDIFTYNQPGGVINTEALREATKGVTPEPGFYGALALGLAGLALAMARRCSAGKLGKL
ncbi:MAG: hypothetical protein ABSF12_01950 [Bryobacteraceae bacterium]|jgi:hypothetical protein